MADMEPEKSEPEVPSVLAYDGYSAAKDPNAPWAILGYMLGVLIAGGIHTVVSLAIMWRDYYDMIQYLLISVVIAMGFAAISMLPAVLSLGLTLWIRRKWIKEVRFGSYRVAVLWGLVGGLYPWSLMVHYVETDNGALVLFFISLGWHLIFPAVAGVFLCQRSHVRD